jgi:hypothetical protein
VSAGKRARYRGEMSLQYRDLVLANTVLFVMRSQLVIKLSRFLVGEKLFIKIYKNLFDPVVVIARKN